MPRSNWIAQYYRELLKGSAIRQSHAEGDDRVQDPYCLRCQPQVVGACLDQMRHVARIWLIEANAVTDNPLVFMDYDATSESDFAGDAVEPALPGHQHRPPSGGKAAEGRLRGELISGGNFHAEPVALAADGMALAIAEVGAVAERRIAMLIDSGVSRCRRSSRPTRASTVAS